MIRATRGVTRALALLCALLAHARGGELNGDVRVLPEEPYGGMVVNQTITFIGRAFYDYFVAAWQEIPMTERYMLSIQEWPSARWGSRIRVEYAQRPVFQAFLPPARANIKAISELAVEIAYHKTVDTEIQRLLFRDPDLGWDEM